MISFPNSKINLGLRILNKRSDGFHNIESVFYPVAWNDVIEVFHANRTSFESYGTAIDGNAEDNLCMKAYRLLENDISLPAVRTILLKNIPIGAGLGGGSADAAFMLKMLNSLFESLSIGLTGLLFKKSSARIALNSSFMYCFFSVRITCKAFVISATGACLFR